MSQAAAAVEPTPQSIVNPDGTTNRIWLSSYVKGVVHDIDLDKYQSLNDYFDECINKFRDRPGFVSIGTEMSNDLRTPFSPAASRHLLAICRASA